MSAIPTKEHLIENDVLNVVRKDFYEDFMEVYAMVVSTTETHPEQVNNKIRGALTHLARALDRGDGCSEEVQKAQAHINRAKRDCLKVIIVQKHKAITPSEKVMNNVVHRGRLRAPVLSFALCYTGRDRVLNKQWNVHSSAGSCSV